MKTERGFTLMELIVALSVVALLVTLGVPSFQEVINSNRLTSTANTMLAAASLARSEAIKRNMRVTLCKSTNGTSCSTDSTVGYDQGWIVFTDPNNNATIDAGETIIQVSQALSAGLKLSSTDANVKDYISYLSTGISQLVTGGFQSGTLTLCKSNYTTSARQLLLSSGGRFRVVKIAAPTTC